VSMKKLAG